MVSSHLSLNLPSLLENSTFFPVTPASYVVKILWDGLAICAD